MRLVAFFCHLPGLWLFYGYRPAASLVRANALAVGATVASIAAAVALVPVGLKLTAGLGVWGLGHALWGAYLARHIGVNMERPAPVGEDNPRGS